MLIFHYNFLSLTDFFFYFFFLRFPSNKQPKGNHFPLFHNKGSAVTNYLLDLKEEGKKQKKKRINVNSRKEYMNKYS